MRIRWNRIITIWVWVFGLSLVSVRANAQEEPGPKLGIPMDVSLGFRGVGEVWRDPVIIRHYRSNRFAGTGFASVGVLPWLMGEIEIGYMRQSDNGGSGVASGALELVPITVSAQARLPLKSGEIYGGLGYSMAIYNEITSVGTVSGTKPGVELRSGVRIQTNLVQSSMWQGNSGGIKRVDLEFMLARRQHQIFGLGSGFDFSAWRLGMGMVIRL